jgi:hypothetical protein
LLNVVCTTARDRRPAPSPLADLNRTNLSKEDPFRDFDVVDRAPHWRKLTLNNNDLWSSRNPRVII